MIKLYKNISREEWKELVRHPSHQPGEIEKTVTRILKKVKKKGDKALRQFTTKFDGVQLKSFLVTDAEVKRAGSLLDEDLKSAIRQAKNNIEHFHNAQIEVVEKTETMPGVTCWRQSLAIEKVGLYIPGGSAPLFSTVLMLAVPALIAGCRKIILCTPPSNKGVIHPAILYTALLCGVTEIYKIGGAQAIAAMAYGTASIPGVHKIFGPGNIFVTTAKQQVQQQGIAIDMPAGPSELLVIADDTAVPEFVAADLLSQAEHGPDSQVLLLTTSEVFAEKVNASIREQIAGLPRKKIILKALQHSKIVLTKSNEESIALSNIYAPEHLILSCADTEEISGKVCNAGSVFIGNYAPESIGDYASGTNHCLPTNGYATTYSGVSVDSFVKKVTFQHLSRDGLFQIGKTGLAMAQAEGLEAHKNAIELRLKN